MKEKIALISVAANVLLAAMKIIVGALSGSAAVLADGFHSLVDVLSSLGVFAGLLLAIVWPQADPVLAILGF